MSCQKYRSRLGTLWVVLFVELVTFSLMTPQVRAQSFTVSLTFPPTESRGAPARTSGGGTRSPVMTSCINGRMPLTALTPSNNVGTTVSPNPTLFWYVPQTEAKSAEFIVVDDRGNEVYQTTLALDGTPGVVKLSLPESVSLETGKNYDWYFGLVCNRGTQETFVRGKLERLELNSEQKTKLAAAKEPLKQAEVYAGAKIWQETLMILAKLREDCPKDSKATQAWEELLNSVQLEGIATAPLVECCKAETSKR